MSIRLMGESVSSGGPVNANSLTLTNSSGGSVIDFVTSGTSPNIYSDWNLVVNAQENLYLRAQAGAVIFDSGNVGIAVSDPLVLFQVHTATNHNVLIYDNTSGSNIAVFNDAGSSVAPLLIDGSIVSINSRFGGNVGIGTASPNATLDVHGLIQFSGTNSTGSTTALLATANCPATTGTAPYTWIKAQSADGSTVYIPCWK